MSSTIMPTIGQGAAATANTQGTAAQARPQSTTTSPAQLGRISQESSRDTAVRKTKNDKNRIPQTRPKRVEATYTSQGKKRVAGKQSSTEESDPENPDARYEQLDQIV